MAGVPKVCIDRAREILKVLESGKHDLSRLERSSSPDSQLDLFKEHPIVEELRTIDVDRLTPVEALNKLAELKNLCRRE